MANADEVDPPLSGDDIGEPVELEKWQRVAAAFAGLMFGAVACIALLDDVDGVGSVAIFLVSLLLLLLAVVGQVPQRIWGKDMGMIMRAREQGRRQGAEETAASTSEAVGPDQLAELLSRLPESTPAAAVSTFARASHFEAEALDVLHQAAHNLGAQVVSAATGTVPDGGWDARIELDGVRIDVTFKYRLTKDTLAQLVLQRAQAGDVLLVVTRYDQSEPETARRVREMREQRPDVIFEVANARIDSVSRHLRRLLSRTKGHQQ